MYLCHCCGNVTEPRQPKKVHTIFREVEATRYGADRRLQYFKRKEIEKEIPICHSCWEQITTGKKTFEQLFQEHHPVKRGPEILTAWPEVVRS